MEEGKLIAFFGLFKVVESNNEKKWRFYCSVFFFFTA